MSKIAIAFLAGILTLLQFNQLPHPVWFYSLMPLSFLLLFISRMRLLAVFLFGLLWAGYHAHYRLMDRLDPQYDGQIFRIQGTIASLPDKTPQRLRFIFMPTQSSLPLLPEKIRVSWYAPYPNNLHAGEQWQLSLKIKAIHGMHNPGGFDYEGWNFRQGIGASAYVRYDKANQKQRTAPWYSLLHLREYIKTLLTHHLAHSPYLGLMTALTIGDRSGITSQQWQILRQTGTSHLLAISGLHIGLAALMGFFVLRLVWSCRSQWLLRLPAHECAALGGILFAVVYAALAGFSVPTQRAMIMVTVVMLSILMRRPAMPSAILSLAMLLVLLWDPLTVLSAGFWLSFTAVALILFVSQYHYPPRKKWGFSIHVLMALGMTPLLLLFFHQSSLIAPIANLIAIPVVSLLIVPLLLISLVLSWSNTLMSLLLHLAEKIFSWLWPVLNMLAQLDFSTWNTMPLPLMYWLAFSLSLFLLLLPRGFPGKHLALFGLLPLWWYLPPKPEPDSAWITLLDVGQGLSVVVQTHSHTLVFDTGPRFSPTFDTGAAVVTPFLNYHGRHHIDRLVISHGDQDHIGGALSLIQAMPVTQILSSVPSRLPHAWPCHQGQRWQWDGVQFDMLHPPVGITGSDNDLSCVLKISVGHHSVLLTGDIERKAEKQLIKKYGTKLQSTILIAPHHGSHTSSSTAFIKMVQPKQVWFPVGYHNRYHFPDTRVMARYRLCQCLLLTTAKSGAITVTISSNAVSQPNEWRKQAQRIWFVSQ